MVDAPGPDPILGWTGSALTSGNYRHVEEDQLRGRRAVLLYGDSFAQCNTPPEQCFQTILERSELGRQYAILNYGVGGYGLDQIYLLLKHSIDGFKDQNPIVIVSLLLESDLDRSLLEFRCWPKPRLDVVDGQLRARGPVQTSVRKYLDQNPPSIRSYLWRLFLNRSSPFMARQRAQWRGDALFAQEKQSLNRKILVEIEHELSSRGLQHFFLIFHAEQGALKRGSNFEWQERMIEDVCAEFSIPLFDTRSYLAFAADDMAKNCARFYGHEYPLIGHHNEIGNLVCFEAIRQGLLRAGPAAPDLAHLARLKSLGLFARNPPALVSTSLLGRAASVVTRGTTGEVLVAQRENPARLLLRAVDEGATTANFERFANASRFTGRLHTIMDSGGDCNESGLRLSIQVNGVVVFEAEVPPAARPLTLDIDLRGKESVSFTVEGVRGPGNCNWVCIEEPRLE